MEEEVINLQKCLQDKDEQLRSSTSSTKQVKTFHSKIHHFLQFIGVERDYVLAEFKSGKSPIMAATDVAARGLGMMIYLNIRIR
jgi:hypothetical protein